MEDRQDHCLVDRETLKNESVFQVVGKSNGFSLCLTDRSAGRRLAPEPFHFSDTETEFVYSATGASLFPLKQSTSTTEAFELGKE